jgi:hypothetical protein
MFLRDVIGAALLLRWRGLGLSMRDRRGNELFLETLVVAAIVGVIVACAAGDMGRQLVKSMLAEAANLTLHHRIDTSEYLAVRGRLPEPDQGPTPGDVSGRFVKQVEWRDGEIVVTMNSRFAQQQQMLSDTDVNDRRPPVVAFRIARAAETGRLIFLCGTAEPPAGFVAAQPRHTSLSNEQLPFFCRH